QHLGAYGDAQDYVLALGAVHLAALAVVAGLGLEMLLVAEVDQGVQPIGRLDPDVAALAAVAAVGAAVGNEFFATERDGARAAVAGANIDLGLIEELHGRLMAQKRGELQVGAIQPLARVSAQTPKGSRQSMPRAWPTAGWVISP